MPPSVARSQLPMHSAHATKEPLRNASVRSFLEGCCTNSTRGFQNLRRKLLLYQRFPKSSTLRGVHQACGAGADFPPPMTRLPSNRRTESGARSLDRGLCIIANKVSVVSRPAVEQARRGPLRECKK